MAWSTSRRKQTLSRDWPAIRKRILTRDGHRCTWRREDTGNRCNEYANQVDHIDGHADNDANLRALCAYHHAQRSAQQGGQAAAARRKAAKKRHPGLLP